MAPKEQTLEDALHSIRTLEKQANFLYSFRISALGQIAALEKRILEFEQLRESCPISCPHKFGRTCNEEIEVTPVCTIVALRDDE
jgi:hypothetical protein